MSTGELTGASIDELRAKIRGIRSDTKAGRYSKEQGRELTKTVALTIAMRRLQNRGAFELLIGGEGGAR